MQHLDQTKIFFESDRITVDAVKGDKVTISVKRNKKPPFQTTVKKDDFSPFLQQRFERVVPGAKLRRASSCFHLRNDHQKS